MVDSDGCQRVRARRHRRAHAQRFWDDESIAERIASHAATQPNGIAFVGDDDLSLTWREYDEMSTGLAAALSQIGLGPGRPSWHPAAGWADAHLLYVAAEKAGLVAIGIGPRARVPRSGSRSRRDSARPRS
jgi:acyl-CoA synthetase